MSSYALQNQLLYYYQIGREREQSVWDTRSMWEDRRSVVIFLPMLPCKK